MTRVLLVDDEPQIIRALRVVLAARGYDVRSAGNGETALEMLAAAETDVVVLDLGLPGIDGVEVLKRLRAFSDIPVIVLSVREGQTDKVAALDAGADDFLTKPFGMEELLARIRAALRRGGRDVQPAVASFDGLEVDLVKRLVKRNGNAVHLTPTEYELLETFVSNRGKLLTHRWLLSRIWGSAHVNAGQSLRVHIAQLRRKLEDDPSRPRWILTEPGMGYRWSES